ncbi:FxSxx-COOH cyclophane-containing RiPP peptide [Spirillospora sp. NPDC049652]|jgi:FXSXX-COOH protein
MTETARPDPQVTPPGEPPDGLPGTVLDAALRRVLREREHGGPRCAAFDNESGVFLRMLRRTAGEEAV